MYIQLFIVLEGLAPYGGQTSSSCGGLVAFGHQMGALRAPIWWPKGPHQIPSKFCEDRTWFD